MKLVLSNLTKCFGDLVAVDNMNLEIEDGESVSLLGPSGCGKTTTLNMIAGFERPTSGEVFFDGVYVNNIHPRERNVGMVFQEYAIFTTMNAYQNIAFGLKVRRLSKKVINEEVYKIAKSLNLQHTLHRNINKLNLSELQRIALARTLSTKPSLLLLDEPLSNLDAALRERTRVELKRFHEQWGITMIYVTHDQIEAIALSNRIAVMNQGRLQQYDTADKIYNEPANIFVAQFIGSPPSNIVRGEIKKTQGRYIFKNGTFMLDISNKKDILKFYNEDRLAIGFRPENILVLNSKKNSLSIPAEVYEVEPTGYETILDLKIDQIIIRALVNSEYSVEVGDRLFVNIDIEHLNLYDVKSEKNLIYGG